MRTSWPKRYQARKKRTYSPTAFRTALTNGSSLFLDRNLDQRSTICRRLRDLIDLHVGDLGGHDCISEAELRLVRRAAMLTLQLELMDQRWATTESGGAAPHELETYQRVCGTLHRILVGLGLERRAKAVNPAPNLQSYLRNRRPAVIETDKVSELEAEE